MLGAEIDSEKRKGQKVILKLAIFSEVTNDYRRYFKELKRLGCVLTGKNGRGFYLTETGIEVAEKLSANSAHIHRATLRPPTESVYPPTIEHLSNSLTRRCSK